MSWIPGADPDAGLDPCPDAIDLVIVPRSADIGGFSVSRVLPFRERRTVGPFIFWDEMGPGEFLTGQGVDVLPHPHIGLSTVTYLEEGSMVHRDSVGSHQVIEPGDVNLMRAGSGVVHSERTGTEVRQGPSKLSGIQSWLASPLATEDAPASFQHVGKASLPILEEPGVTARVVLGEYAGAKAPVDLDWETLYLDVQLDAGAKFELNADTEERAIYTFRGSLSCEGTEFPRQRMLVIKPGFTATLRAEEDARFLVLGGAPLDGPRKIWWNFVASSRERIEEAKERWRKREFPEVPGEGPEFVPLPE